MENDQFKQQIIKEINKFLAMTPETDNDTLTKQFSYIKGNIDTELGYETVTQNEVNTQAFNLMDAYSNEDIQFFFPEKDDPKPVIDKSAVLRRLQDRAGLSYKTICWVRN